MDPAPLNGLVALCGLHVRSCLGSSSDLMWQGGLVPKGVSPFPKGRGVEIRGGAVRKGGTVIGM